MTTSVLPQSNEEYGTKEYWNTRYSKEDEESTFDWFKTYADISDMIRGIIPDKSSRILMLGCGNSTLSEDMWSDGYHDIVNIDYSSIVIEQMRRRHPWLEMDVRDLQFPDGSFDIAIDKGTMDAMMTLKGDVWDPPQQVIDDCTKEVDEVVRVLCPDSGIFVYLTFGQPHFRRRYLMRPGTNLEIKQLGEAFHYYLYVLRRS
ncbi:S-adenosyl-L-methionine-dependent methyltransferase [Fistulina hepatica ATCC 64428]|uniref:S-adenosyl-L-methionine-dependent methyltransferase n=1 Tax=Fistulina hepatica ATCC 64428 TaxID=1128425 RepID=A0A0D7ACJ8_9AGAR|nr:S-adenosyl-L-methionine-dependent methyltransferase [Fistulina hepatica ATCC 64428]